jgi:nitroreductase/NAD-dependent dihydropyrimidine dehydrogenase PreA subunit
MIKIDNSKCKKDYLCIDECAYGFMFEIDDEGYPAINQSLFDKYCIKCWHCIAICPKGAMSHPGVNPENFDKLRGIDALSHDQAENFIRSRRSFRTFKKESVPDEIISKWLNITRWSPTASNSQQLNWVLVKDARQVARLAGIVIGWLEEKNGYKEIIDQWNQGHDIVLRHAPHLLIVTLPEDYSWAMTDAATAISHLELTASTLGLGTCWAGFFTRASLEYAPLKNKLDIPENHKVAGALMFGYPMYRFKKIPERKKIAIQYL